MGVIEASVTRACQSDHQLPCLLRQSIRRPTPPVAVSQRSSALFPIRCQHPPSMSFAQPKDGRRFMCRYSLCHQPVQNL